MKLLSLLIAIGLWMVAKQIDPIVERSIQFQVEFQVDPSAAIISRNPSDRTVTAIVTGPVSQLEILERSFPKAVIDARGVPFNSSVELTPTMESGQRGLRARFQRTFTIRVDTLARQEFSPQEVGEGVLMSGYYISTIHGIPQVLVAEGGTTQLSKVARIVYYLNFSSLSGSTELSVEFTPVDEHDMPVEFINVIPATADIAIDLQPSESEKRVPVVVNYQGTPANNYALTAIAPDPFLVDVSGSVEDLAEITSIYTETINLTGKTQSFTETVNLIPTSSGMSLNPPAVTVRVSIEQHTSTSIFRDIMIDPRGMNPNYIYDFSTDRATVTIRGGIDRVSEVTGDLIRPQISLSNLEPGTHEVRVTVALPSNVFLDSIEPGVVTVIITNQSGGDDQPSEETTPVDPE